MNLMEDLKLTVDEFKQIHQAFMGGFTHANANYVHKTCINVASYDITSSYPIVMAVEKFPMSKFQLIEDDFSLDEFYELLNTKACVFDITLHNVVPKLHQDHPIPSSKCWKLSKDAILDNGRVVTATELTMTIIEQDFFTYSEFYEWDDWEVHNLRIADKNYLPKPFVKAILKLYSDKTLLKGLSGKEIEYQVAKAMLNACYGMMVTNPCRDEIIYKSDYTYETIKATTDEVIEELLNKHNNSVKRFLFYPWGVWVTAYARRNLFTIIRDLGKDYIYADTDSVKFLNIENHKDLFNKYNKNIYNKIDEASYYNALNIGDFSPQSQKGEIKTMGLWDYEGMYKRFKTLGAKRYLVEKDNGTYELTMAGVNKVNALRYLEGLSPLVTDEDFIKAKTDIPRRDPFDLFKFGTVIPAEYSGRLTSLFIDDETEGWVVDYTGVKRYFHELSSINMSKTDYEIEAADDFLEFLFGINVTSLM